MCWSQEVRKHRIHPRSEERFTTKGMKVDVLLVFVCVGVKGRQGAGAWKVGQMNRRIFLEQYHGETKMAFPAKPTGQC